MIAAAHQMLDEIGMMRTMFERKSLLAIDSWGPAGGADA